MSPQLRFPSHNEGWELLQMRDICSINQGLQIAIKDRLTEYVEGAKFYITNEFLNPKATKKYFIVNPPQSVTCVESDILMTRTGNTGAVVTGVRGAFHNNFFKISYNGIHQFFLYHFLNTTKTQREILNRAGTSTIPDLNHGDFYSISIAIPDAQEQQKIADFLTAVDQRLEQLRQKHALLLTWKKGVMQQLFSGAIRFKDDEGNDFPAWEEKQLSDISLPVKTKNITNEYSQVFTNSALNGIIPQRDFFDHNVANQSNLSGYYIVENNDFVYNPRISNSAPVGPIKRNHLGTGVMSPLYSVFRFNSGESNTFFEYYFSTSLWHKYMHSIANFGARHDRMNITSCDFKKLKLPYPLINEQTKIANCLTAIDEKIDAVAQQIEQTQTFKQGLLQQMFV